MLTTILLIGLLFGCGENRNVCDGGIIVPDIENVASFPDRGLL
tara:strand:- start:386 stop:514 length:129 start_codon:yes stop_codon:yes gene_type:complete